MSGTNRLAASRFADTMSNITKDQVNEWLSSQSVIEIAALVKDS